ncbi:MAG: hypothetical protein WBG70_03295 [Spirulinaceae cyanobacterium]
MLRTLLSIWGYFPVFFLALLVTLTWGQILLIPNSSNAASQQDYQVDRDLVYKTVNDHELKLDLDENI